MGRKVNSARLLNERSGWMGLGVMDLIALGYLLIACNLTLKPWGLELLSFLIVGLVALFLIRVRLRNRPKTIRDYLRSKLTSKIIG